MLGRKRIPLPEGLSADAHEARRMSLGLSRREYAAKVGMSQSTYIRKVMHVGAPRKTHAQKNGADLDFLAKAQDFVRLRPQYVEALKHELAAARQAVVQAELRVVEIQKAIEGLRVGSPENPEPTGPAKWDRRRRGGNSIVSSALSILREGGRPMHALSEILPALEAKGHTGVQISNLYSMIMRSGHAVRTAPGPFEYK
jgi:hypothetical protein